PKTGIGLTEHSVVCILAPTATAADVLASSVSVLGVEKGIALIESLPAAEAMIVRVGENAAGAETFYSKGWQDALKPDRDVRSLSID
ncbi:MAG TPA: hypothetical protein DEB39_09505, partial [Planctomycetaceae bacterium]|nr:hypothetical protein [Planctomycetaceae bacterium]